MMSHAQKTILKRVRASDGGLRPVRLIQEVHQLTGQDRSQIRLVMEGMISGGQLRITNSLRLVEGGPDAD